MFHSFIKLAGALALALPASSFAFDQWATKVVDFSSQYSPTNYGAGQALKAPDVKTYSDNPLAWTPANANLGTEFITVSYLKPVYATGASIVESYGWGFITAIDAIDIDGVAHQVWAGTDNGIPNQINTLVATWPKTTYQVQSLTIHVNTLASPSWEEIDAIKLTGIEPVAGTLTSRWGHTMTLTCTNVTTGQTITTTLTGPGAQGAVSAWDCEDAGLKVKKGQTVNIELEGKIAN